MCVSYVCMSCLIKLWTIHIIHFTHCFRQNPRQRNVINLDNVLMIDSCQHIMDTCLTVILLHDYCTQTYSYINLHKLFTLRCNFICVLSVVIIKTDDDDDDDADVCVGSCISDIRWINMNIYIYIYIYIYILPDIGQKSSPERVRSSEFRGVVLVWKQGGSYQAVKYLNSSINLVKF